MRILLTGASSFTGYWFAQTLCAAGHDVTATFHGDAKDYYGDDRRSQRVRNLMADGPGTMHFSCTFGSKVFVDLTKHTNFDLLCLHGASVKGYNKPDFDAVAATAENTRNIAAILENLRRNGLRAAVATGTVFEPGEGVAEGEASQYGNSKAATFEFFKYWCDRFTIPLGKFVIPNPFGSYEETSRWCAKAVAAWKQGDWAVLNTPSYVRDNIHVDYLAWRYATFCQNIVDGLDFRYCTPSGYVESMGDFANRFAREIGTRLKINCLYRIEETGYDEPISIHNNDDPLAYLEWNHSNSWDKIAEFYKAF